MSYIIRLAVLPLFIISSLAFFSKPKQEEYLKNKGHSWEEYDPTYFNRFQNIQGIVNYSDSCLSSEKRNTLAYYNFTAGTIRKRFYHGYSHYQFSDNPLSYLAGICIWDDLSAIVIPDDIMKHPMAACSQQSIVLMEVFRRNHIPYRKVDFGSHFAVEGFIENQWRFFDPDMEPRLDSTRPSLDTLVASNKIDLAYANSGLSRADLYKILNHPKEGGVDENPALRATLFHKICLLLVSKWFLLSVFLLSFWSDIRFTVLKRMIAEKNNPAYHGTEVTF